MAEENKTVATLTKEHSIPIKSTDPKEVNVQLESPRRRSVFTTLSPPPEDPLRLLIGSWNVGNAMPPKNKAKINAWIPEGGGDFDVIVVGLQESSYKEKHTDEEDDTSPPEEDEKESEIDEEALASQSTNGDTTDQKKQQETTEKDDDKQEEEDNEDKEQEDQSSPNTTDGSPKLKRSVSMGKFSQLVRKMSANLRDSVAESMEYPFLKQLYFHLGDHYALVGKVELMEMRIFVFVHDRNNVSFIEKNSVPTGLGSVLGNKGGLLFKLVIRNTSLCFVSCHLAAHQDQKFLDKRNADCASILSTHFGTARNISLDYQFDHCFWFGDLNYRIDLHYTDPKDNASTCTSARTHEQHVEQVLELVKEKKWEFLNENDQLRKQIEQKKTLMGWTLPPAIFEPTFKRIRRTEDQYNKQRIPSYCDRILHKSLPGLKENLKIKNYNCVQEITTSDHKPVFMEFEIQPTHPIHVNTNLSSGRSTLIEIQDLEASDLLAMDLTGLSDPYIKFYSVPSNAMKTELSGSHPSTATITNTLSPHWKNNQIPKLYILCDNEQDVRKVHIVFLVMDYDTTSKDDVMGMFTLSLDPFVSPLRPCFAPFESELVRHGKPAGKISGKIRVTLPSQAPHIGGYLDAESVRNMARCHCCVS